MSSYEVYDGEVHVLSFQDGAGVLMSTAALPPGVEPRQHPFLTGTAHSARHEHTLGQLLGASSSTPEFVEKLKEQGLQVRPR